MNRDLEVGDYVMLSPCTKWDLTDKNNPVDTIGIVTEVDACISVVWHETEEEILWNTYDLNDSDLVKVEE
jgi:hypothetical protein